MENPKTILVAGATNDLGKHLLKRLAKEECQLILLDTNQEKLDQISKQLNSPLAKIESYCIDWANYEELESVFENVYERFQFIDTLVSLLDECSFHASETRPKFNEYVHLMNVNFFTNVSLVNNILPLMLDENRGSIIALGARKIRDENYYSTAYLSSKAALTSYWREIQRECFKKEIQLTLFRYNDPAFSNQELTDENIGRQPEDRAPVFEQAANMLEAVIFQRHCNKVHSISLG